jgi:predicted enzyme related to lactoylglutathione lyase
MEMTEYVPGTPSWVDLGTADIAAALAFYSGLFGWECEDQGEDAGHYTMCRLRGKNVAAISGQQNPGPPLWTTYVSVADADATAKKVAANGGTTLVEPFDVFDAGRMAVFMDPSGAAFSIWQPNRHIGAEIVNEPGALSWNELTTRDKDGAKAFYPAVFGWKAQDHGEYLEWELDGRVIAGLMPMVGDMWPPEVPNHWMVYFAVANTDASAARAAELGGTVSVPPTDIPPGRFAVINDPTGGTFSIITMSGEHA